MFHSTNIMLFNNEIVRSSEAYRTTKRNLQ
jgi:hypothetical protein